MRTRAEFGYDTPLESEVVVTRLDAALNWVRKNSLWPMPMGLACCAIEFMATAASRFDISRFGSEVARFSPRHSPPGPEPKYEPVAEILSTLWQAAEQLCGKRLVEALPLWLHHYQRHHGKLLLERKSFWPK